jgi:hypothetical protein
MQTKDKHDLLAKWGQHAVAILGNPATRDYEVVDLGAGPLGPEYVANFAERGLVYVGIYAMLCGEFRQAYALPLEPDVIVALATDYASFLLAKIANPTPKCSGDGAEWLARLWEMPDARDAN